jgi:hypothetical protein
MNKRIHNKLAKMATARDFTVQEAWDKVAESLAFSYPKSAACYFIDEREDETLQIHAVGYGPIISSTRKYDDMKKPDEIEYPLWEHEIEPEEVTFYCNDCGADMNAQTDIANEGLCDPCNEGKKEMWAAEQKHEAYEYRNMKL